jgi:hypothetical protein
MRFQGREFTSSVVSGALGIRSFASESIIGVFVTSSITRDEWRTAALQYDRIRQRLKTV